MTNIALIVLDTLRKDAFDEYFDWLPGTHFENAWSPSAWTTPVHAALFGGAYPSELGVYAKTESLTCDRSVLAESLSNAGYQTRAFSANANVASAFNFDRGFDAFQHSWRGKKHDENIFDWGDFISKTQDQGPSRFLRAIYECVIDDVNTIDSLSHGIKMKARDLGVETISGTDDGAKLALEYVQETNFGDEEFFFANLMEAHGPYNPPTEYQTGEYTASPNIDDTIGDGPNESQEVIRGAYDDCVRYLSDVYQDMFAELREDFNYIITLGDHGELFGMDGVWGHNHGIYTDLVHVPLSVYTGQDSMTYNENLVSLIDVHQTILNFAGIETASRGHNLLETPPERDLLVERHGLRTNRIKQMTVNDYDKSTIDRYDRDLFGIVLPEGYYEYETLDGFSYMGDHKRSVNSQARLEELRSELNEMSVSLEGESLPEDVQERLKDLGYA